MPEEYSAESYYIASTDKRGHREQLRATNVTPGLHGAMAVVLGSGIFPYKTFGDIQRDALHQRVYYLLEQLDDSEFVARAKKELQVDRVIAQAEARESALEAQRRLVDLVMGQLDDNYASLDGIDFRPLRDAYHSITFRSVSEDFERRLQRVSIDPGRDLALDDEE